jgi:hypothetical protein
MRGQVEAGSGEVHRKADHLVQEEGDGEHHERPRQRVVRLEVDLADDDGAGPDDHGGRQEEQVPVDIEVLLGVGRRLWQHQAGCWSPVPSRPGRGVGGAHGRPPWRRCPRRWRDRRAVQPVRPDEVARPQRGGLVLGGSVGPDQPERQCGLDHHDDAQEPGGAAVGPRAARLGVVRPWLPRAGAACLAAALLAVRGGPTGPGTGNRGLVGGGLARRDRGRAVGVGEGAGKVFGPRLRPALQGGCLGWLWR